MLPAIINQPANQTVAEGQTATFSVTATGSSPMSFQWQHNGVCVPDATDASYTTPATTSADNGVSFVCVISNSASGVDSSPAILINTLVG
jgi:hypothetical protein